MISFCASGPERADGNREVISTNANICKAAQVAEVKESGWKELFVFFFILFCKR